ncbi:protein of unknown function DUF3987 [Vibrio phage 1.197.A._10N.286.54.F2]|nr:protein of unknown function DUF3987 [Vibrio phage 1.197.A._10N.286.54.F2]
MELKSSAVITPFLDDTICGMAAKELAEKIQFPPNTAAVCALAAASHAVGAVYSVGYPDGRQLPIPLYAVAEQPSGTSKTRIVTDLYDGYMQQAIIINDKVRKDREVMKRSIADQIKKGIEPNENEQQMFDALVEVPTGTSDATPQGLEKPMARNGGYFLVYGTEQNLTKTLLGGLFSDGQVSDGVINSGFNAEMFSSERASSERVTFSGHPFGGILCVSQGGTIQTILESAGGSGLAERFWMIREDDMLGKRSKFKCDDRKLIEIMTGGCKPTSEMTKQSSKKHKMTAYNQYSSAMGRMAKERHNLGAVKFDGLHKLRFSPEAWGIIEAAKEFYERSIGKQEVRNSFISSLNSKIDVHVMKTAATIHVTNCAEYQTIPSEITPDCVISALAVVQALFSGVEDISAGNKLYGDEAEDQCVYDYVEQQKRPVNAAKIKQEISRSKKKDSPFQFYTKHGEKPKKIEAALERMVKCGKITCNSSRTPAVYLVMQ